MATPTAAVGGTLPPSRCYRANVTCGRFAYLRELAVDLQELPAPGESTPRFV